MKFKTPEELFKYMNKNFKYNNDFNNNIQSPEELEKSKSGHCYEQTLYELKYLTEMGLIPQAWFMAGVDEDKYYVEDSGSHTFVTYVKDNKVYYFENTWDGHKGIEKFHSIRQLKDTVGRRFIKESNKPIHTCLIIKGLRGTAGMSIEEFFEACIGIKHLKNHL